VRREYLQHRQRKARRLAGSRLGASHDVAPLEDGGDGLRLDRGGMLVALFGNCAQQFRHQLQRSKRHFERKEKRAAGAGSAVALAGDSAAMGVGVGVEKELDIKAVSIQARRISG
jgi:hypothetical protein